MQIMRKKPVNLAIMESLMNRSTLSDDEIKYYHNQVKGFEGELAFDAVLEKEVPVNRVLRDLLLKMNGTTFQIDSLVIADKKVYLYEVKNYEGELLYTANRLIYNANGSELLNPVSQVQRSALLLQQLFKKHGISFDCEPSVVFIHPNCTLYQESPNSVMLVPSLFSKHFKKVNEEIKKHSRRHMQVKELLLKENKVNSPFIDVPHYTFESLNKGIYCANCQQSLQNRVRRTCYCRKCEYKETAFENAKRHIQEYQVLFPGQPLKTRTLVEWCDGTHSMYRIRTVLKSLTHS